MGTAGAGSRDGRSPVTLLPLGWQWRTILLSGPTGRRGLSGGPSIGRFRSVHISVVQVVSSLKSWHSPLVQGDKVPERLARYVE